MDPIGDVQPGVAPRRLNEAHQVAAGALAFELLGRLGFELHDSGPIGERSRGVPVAGAQHQGVLRIVKNLSGSLDLAAFAKGPLTTLHRRDHLLGLLSQARADRGRYDGEDFVCDRR